MAPATSPRAVGGERERAWGSVIRQSLCCSAGAMWTVVLVMHCIACTCSERIPYKLVVVIGPHLRLTKRLQLLLLPPSTMGTHSPHTMSCLHHDGRVHGSSCVASSADWPDTLLALQSNSLLHFVPFKVVPRLSWVPTKFLAQLSRATHSFIVLSFPRCRPSRPDCPFPLPRPHS